MCSRRNANFELPPMRKNSQKQIHYGLCKGNKNFVTFTTNFVTFATNKKQLKIF